jgi:hypothetical protein
MEFFHNYLITFSIERLGLAISILVKKTEIAATGIRRADHLTTSIHKSWHQLRRQAAVARLV